MHSLICPITNDGPILNVVFGVSSTQQAGLIGAPIRPFCARGLIDTGASHTSVDPSIITELQISSVGTGTALSSTTTREADIYSVDLYIYTATPQIAPRQFPNLSVSVSDLYSRHGFHALIGRDVLSQCVLIYQGINNVYTLLF